MRASSPRLTSDDDEVGVSSPRLSSDDDHVHIDDRCVPVPNPHLSGSNELLTALPLLRFCDGDRLRVKNDQVVDEDGQATASRTTAWRPR